MIKTWGFCGDHINTYSYNFKEGARNNIGAMVDKVCQNTCVMKCNKVSGQWPTPVYQQQIFIVVILINIFSIKFLSGGGGGGVLESVHVKF